MKDTLSTLLPASPFDNREEQHSLVIEMVNQLKAVNPLKLQAISSFAEKYGYYVEFPLYTSFPSNISITSENYEAETHTWVNMTVVERAIAPISSKPSRVQLPIAYLCILIIPIKDDAFNGGDTQLVYDFCEAIVNKYIKLYKLLPTFHHHDLIERNNTNSGMITPVLKYKVHPTIEFVSAEALYLNDGPVHIFSNSAPISEDSLQLLVSGFTRDDWYEYQDVMRRLVRAYDFNCHGDADAAIIFSSSAIEGFFMVTELLIRVREQGESYDTALTAVKRKNLASLVPTATALYGLNADKSSQRTIYGKWHGRCYKKRNDIIHRQGLYKPTDSRPAIDASSALILHISQLVKRTYPHSASVMDLVGLIAKSHLRK